MSEDIRRLLLAHFTGDEDDFRAAAWDLVKRERRLKHTVLADELERILKESNGLPNGSQAFFRNLENGNLPKDKDNKTDLVEIEQPKRKLDELVLSDVIRNQLDRVVFERKNNEVLRSHGLKPMAKLLFCGPPGCGKTAAAEALAKELYLPFATVRFDAVVSSYLGETASNLRQVFDFARQRPVLLFFDEFDAIGKHRSALDEHGELKRVVNSFLQLLDGFHSETLTLAATNHQGLLDPALWRRFDDIVLFEKPTVEEIQTHMTQLFREIPLAKSIRLGSIAKQLSGFSYADVERLAVDAIKETVLSDHESVMPVTLHSGIERQLRRNRVTAGHKDSMVVQKTGKRRTAKRN